MIGCIGRRVRSADSSRRSSKGGSKRASAARSRATWSSSADSYRASPASSPKSGGLDGLGSFLAPLRPPKSAQLSSELEELLARSEVVSPTTSTTKVMKINIDLLLVSVRACVRAHGQTQLAPQQRSRWVVQQQHQLRAVLLLLLLLLLLHASEPEQLTCVSDS